jgi:hypothetical protein
MQNYIDVGTRVSVVEAKKIIAYMQDQIEEILRQRKERKTALKRKAREKKKKLKR